MRCRGFDAEEIADRPSASMVSFFTVLISGALVTFTGVCLYTLRMCALSFLVVMAIRVCVLLVPPVQVAADLVS